MRYSVSTILASATAAALWLLRDRTRRKPVGFDIKGTTAGIGFARALAGITWGQVIEGNQVTVIQNSGFFDALITDIGVATSTVHLETFLWQDGKVSDGVTAALCAAATRGVEVRVLVDQRGSKKTDAKTWERMRAAGVELHLYHRTRLRDIAWVNHRDHRKIAVIDGRIGYTFGHGMADMWGAGTKQHPGWRDTAIRLRGPAVHAFQTAFMENWTKTTREAPVAARYFPALHPCGTTPVHFAWVTPPETAGAVKRLYYAAIASAKREVIIENPYFIPDRQAIQLCREASARGVSISIVLPSARTSDFAVVQHASHRYYGRLLAAGVRIWEFTRCGLHQKVMVVDGEWCTLGSTNFDPRSFNINDEITVAIHDPDVAAELRRAFEEDVRDAEEWTLAKWKRRSMRHRIVDGLSALVKRQL